MFCFRIFGQNYTFTSCFCKCLTKSEPPTTPSKNGFWWVFKPILVISLCSYVYRNYHIYGSSLLSQPQLQQQQINFTTDINVVFEVHNFHKYYQLWRSHLFQIGTSVQSSSSFFFFFLFLFFFFLSVVYFSHRRSARIKKLMVRNLTGAPKKHGLHPFLDPVGHFGAPWRPFWIFVVLIEG